MPVIESAYITCQISEVSGASLLVGLTSGSYGDPGGGVFYVRPGEQRDVEER